MAQTRKTSPSVAEYSREYRKTHAAAIFQNRLRYAAKLLTLNGYTVTPPTDQQQSAATGDEGRCE